MTAPETAPLVAEVTNSESRNSASAFRNRIAEGDKLFDAVCLSETNNLQQVAKYPPGPTGRGKWQKAAQLRLATLRATPLRSGMPASPLLLGVPEISRLD
jgi:hypothetical protein